MHITDTCHMQHLLSSTALHGAQVHFGTLRVARLLSAWQVPTEIQRTKLDCLANISVVETLEACDFETPFWAKMLRILRLNCLVQSTDDTFSWASGPRILPTRSSFPTWKRTRRWCGSYVSWLNLLVDLPLVYLVKLNV